jgi:hypothetical protein
MAGVKITDLGTITSAASDDLLYIVDVSNTTQSPQGTSSQIELGNIVSSSTWTPVITGIVGAATINIVGTSRYFKINDMVVDTCRFSIEMAAAQTTESFNLSCAVEPSTNFTSARDIISIWSSVSDMNEFETINSGAVSGQKYGVVSVTLNTAEITSEIIIQRTYSAL